jgi:hypothetical protein
MTYHRKAISASFCVELTGKRGSRIGSAEATRTDCGCERRGAWGEAGEKCSAMLDKTKSTRDDVGPVDPVAR